MKTKKFLWIADFQHTSKSGIKTRAACIEGSNIQEATKNAYIRIRRYMEAARKEDRFVVTDIGIAEESERELLDTVWADRINEPYPELFE